MRGLVMIDRDLLEHPSFAAEAYTEREAFIWMISEASYTDRAVRTKKGVVHLKRGQLTASTRFMAEKWGWKQPRVRRFLKRLKIDSIIDPASDPQTDSVQTVITICNYNKYQDFDLYRDSVATRQATRQTTQQRPSSGPVATQTITPDVIPDVTPDLEGGQGERDQSAEPPRREIGNSQKNSSEPENQPDPTGLPGKNPGHADQPPPENPEKPPETGADPPRSGMTETTEIRPQSGGNRRTRTETGEQPGNPGKPPETGLTAKAQAPPKSPETQANPESSTPAKGPKNHDQQPKRGNRLATDWQPDAADWRYAAERGYDAEQIADLAEGFRDHWTAKPGSGAVKLDWAATWRNWLRNDIKFHGDPGGRRNAGKPNAGAGGFARAAAEVAADFRRRA